MHDDIVTSSDTSFSVILLSSRSRKHSLKLFLHNEPRSGNGRSARLANRSRGMCTFAFEISCLLYTYLILFDRATALWMLSMHPYKRHARCEAGMVLTSSLLEEISRYVL